jgi:hypothetical protein
VLWSSLFSNTIVGRVCIGRTNDGLKEPLELRTGRKVRSILVNAAAFYGASRPGASAFGVHTADQDRARHHLFAPIVGNIGNSSLDEDRTAFREFVPIDACRKRSRAGFSSL